MDQIFKQIEQITFQIKCGKKSGTAFFITPSIVMTAYHVIKEQSDGEMIYLYKNGSIFCNCDLSKSIVEKYKRLDIALLISEKELNNTEFLKLGFLEKIPVGTNWKSRGYPVFKESEGENIYQENNKVNQHLDSLAENKYDIQLDHHQKWTQYSGFSGAPLIIADSIVGIVNEEILENNFSKELRALSLYHFKDLLEENSISVERINNPTDKNIDLAAIKEYRILTNPNRRNLPEKLKDACPTISTPRINNYCKELASGKTEINLFSEQDISAIKFRVYEACRNELLNFVETRSDKNISVNEVEELMDKYQTVAYERIKNRSEDYRYVKQSRDFLKKIILDLINDCYISFDGEELK